MSFQRFLSLVEALRHSSGFPAIDAVEERMLNSMAATWHSGKRITVMEAMHMFPGISPSTVHRRLKSLRAQGMIELVSDEVDTRIKYVTASTRAKDYFASLDRCMLEAQH
jgi:DNA-binding MarR family transcriptional regulator